MKIIHLRFGVVFFVSALLLTGLTAFKNEIGTEAMVSRALTSAVIFSAIGVIFSIVLTKAGFFVKNSEETEHDYALPNKFDPSNTSKKGDQAAKSAAKAMEPFSPETIDPEVSNILNRLPKGGAESSIQNAVDAMRMMGLDDE